jgi:S-(hydroxymethyl)glutathione dehydrogenase/alcohol dehydrogenase
VLAGAACASKEPSTMEFRAAVLHEIGKPLAIERVRARPLQPTDVLVRVRASGLCHTDLEVIDGQLARPLPIVLGHEGAGVVEAVGADVRAVRPGDHVICSWNPSCGHCFYCERGTPILCEPVMSNHPRGFLLDGRSRLSLASDVPLHHYSMVSSHAEFCVVPEAGAIAVPAEIPFDRACVIGCAVMTGYGAATRVAPVGAGASVVVAGCGAVGLNVIQGAVARNASRIIGIDPEPARRAQALAFGATDVIDAARGDAVAAVREMTHGRGADFAFEAAGHEDAMRLALEAARPGGDVVILGKIGVDRELRLRFGALMGEKRIVRSSYGGARPQADFPALAGLYLAGKLMLDALITRRIGLDDINAGFAPMRDRATLRTVVVFD